MHFPWLSSNELWNCYSEEPMLTPHWICLFDFKLYFSLLLLLQSYIVACLREPCLSAWLLMFSFQEDNLTLPTCEWMMARKKKLTHLSLEGGHSRRCFARLIALFTLLHHCLSLSTLPFLLNFLIISLSGSIKEPGIQTQTRWLFWDISLPSSWSAGFLNKVIFLASAHCLLFYWPVVQQAEQAWTW